MRAVISGELEVGDAAHDVGSFFDGFAHEVLAVRERENSLLWERNDLQCHIRFDFIAKFKQCVQRGETRVGHIHMSTDVLDSTFRHHQQCPSRAVFDILDGQGLLALRPDADAVEQRSGLIPFRIACGECRIEVHVRVYKWWNQQSALGIDHLVIPGWL